MNLKIEKEEIERVRELMLRIKPNRKNKPDFNEAFVIISRMLFAEEIGGRKDFEMKKEIEDLKSDLRLGNPLREDQQALTLKEYRKLSNDLEIWKNTAIKWQIEYTKMKDLVVELKANAAEDIGEIEHLKDTLDEQAEFHKKELNQCQENFDAKHKIIEQAQSFRLSHEEWVFADELKEILGGKS